LVIEVALRRRAARYGAGNNQNAQGLGGTTPMMKAVFAMALGFSCLLAAQVANPVALS